MFGPCHLHTFMGRGMELVSVVALVDTRAEGCLWSLQALLVARELSLHLASALLLPQFIPYRPVGRVHMWCECACTCVHMRGVVWIDAGSALLGWPAVLCCCWGWLRFPASFPMWRCRVAGVTDMGCGVHIYAVWVVDASTVRSTCTLLWGRGLIFREVDHPTV